MSAAGKWPRHSEVFPPGLRAARTCEVCNDIFEMTGWSLLCGDCDGEDPPMGRADWLTMEPEFRPEGWGEAVREPTMELPSPPQPEEPAAIPSRHAQREAPDHSRQPLESPGDPNQEGAFYVRPEDEHAELLRPEAAARRLSISRSRVYELMASGELGSILIGRSRRVPRECIIEFIASAMKNMSHPGGTITPDD